MSGRDEPQAAPVAVFRGSRAACSEAGLVLEAQGLAYETVALDRDWVLLVEPSIAASAHEELARYATERSVKRFAPAAFIPFEGAGIGIGGFALVLLVTAYCTGIQAFGIDWLDAGSLNSTTREWWRAVTALTLHLDQAHLLGNLLFGIGFGALAGRAFGPGVAWASILAAAATSNYVEMLISPPAHRAAGASTAVFAALGLLAGFAWRRTLNVRERLRYRWAPLVAGVFLLAFLGSGGEHVDVLGHALGFVAGIGLGWLYARSGFPRSRGRLLQAGSGLAALGLVAIAWVLALRR